MITGSPLSTVHIPVTGLGATHCGTVKALVSIQLSSTYKDYSSTVNAEAYVLPHLTKTFQPRRINTQSWPQLKALTLSDPGSSSLSKIDLVIGADLYGQILLDGLMKGPPGTPVAQHTIFGWVLSGQVKDVSPDCRSTEVAAFHCSLDLTLTQELMKFWEIEEVNQRPHLTPEEVQCEEHFQATHSRGSYGRFMVRLPRRSNVPLGDSQFSAMRSFQRNELRRLKDASLNQAYQLFMKEYLELGHMAVVSATSQPVDESFYLPHHAVWKSEGSSSKIRVVFNASSRTSSGFSLNDGLLPGPKLHQEIGNVLRRWRRHAVALTSDIVKMFRQILVHPEDQPLQRIFWRDTPDQELQTFQLQTVTYGTTCAPYLAIRCLHQLALDEMDKFPEAARVLQTQTYVDDILFGAETRQRALELKTQLEGLVMAGGFQLAKWSSNCPELSGNDNFPHVLSDGTVKTLGILWNPETDNFEFRVQLEALEKITKRSTLSCIVKLFDPLGWLAPVLIVAKIFIQDLWTVKCDWDTVLPPSLEAAWSLYYSGLTQLKDIRIPRWIPYSPESSWELHGFCDASQRAYAAAVYFRTTSSDGIFQTSLLVAKTKVAPLKVVSIPRLELCGAVLLARLMANVLEALQVTANARTHAWTDSQIVLHWVNSVPARWKCFVANRVAEIHRLLPHTCWHHVPSAENPADLPSRGITPGELLENSLWWSGPHWLRGDESCWPQVTPTPQNAEILREQNTKAQCFQITVVEPWDLLDNYSSLKKLLRVTSWLFRSSHNFRNLKAQRRIGPLTVQELLRSRNFWIRTVQRQQFPLELRSLQNGTGWNGISKSSPIKALQPFLDSEGLLRVGGRLRNADMTFEEKHPIILSAQSNFAKLLLIDAHQKTLHGGPQQILSYLSNQFWIIRGRSLARKISHSCLNYLRQIAKGENPMVGQLPVTRVTPSRPFLHTGLDYAGPIQLKFNKGRGQKTFKGYIAVFICMATKAMHLEAVSDCTTAGFIAAFKRFCARRGIPATLSSDQATNFRGADAELRSLFDNASKESLEIAALLANDGTQWKFIPPHSPHFGGLWEAGVKSVKHHLRRTIGDTILIFEELATVLAEIEACLNSRPLTPLRSSPQDLGALTPAHFLVGSSLKTVPEPSLLEVPLNRLDRWQLLRRLYEEFWRRWSSEYVHQLQQRTKWHTNSPNLKIDDLVLVKEDNLPPSRWCLGRVTQVHPGNDGIVRVATIRTATSELRRPVVKLCRLPAS